MHYLSLVLPQPKMERSPSSDSKGKSKQEEPSPDSMQLDDSKKEVEQEADVEMDDTEENEKGDPEEEILMTVVPKANINGLKYSGGIRTR